MQRRRVQPAPELEAIVQVAQAHGVVKHLRETHAGGRGAVQRGTVFIVAGETPRAGRLNRSTHCSSTARPHHVKLAPHARHACARPGARAGGAGGGSQESCRLGACAGMPCPQDEAPRQEMKLPRASPLASNLVLFFRSAAREAGSVTSGGTAPAAPAAPAEVQSASDAVKASPFVTRHLTPEDSREGRLFYQLQRGFAMGSVVAGLAPAPLRSEIIGKSMQQSVVPAGRESGAAGNQGCEQQGSAS